MDLPRILSNCSAGKFDLRIGRRPRVRKNEVDLVLLVCEDEGNPNPPTPLISETNMYGVNQNLHCRAQCVAITPAFFNMYD